MRFLPVVALAPLLITSAEAASWPTTATCTAHSNLGERELTLVSNRRVDAEGVAHDRFYLKATLPTRTLDDGERVTDATMEVPGQARFVVTAAGSTQGDRFAVSVFPTETDVESILLAIAKGSVIELNVGQSEAISFSLEGSAQAVWHLRACLE